jgi:hypothetical protein
MKSALPIVLTLFFVSGCVPNGYGGSYLYEVSYQHPDTKARRTALVAVDDSLDSTDSEVILNSIEAHLKKDPNLIFRSQADFVERLDVIEALPPLYPYYTGITEKDDMVLMATCNTAIQNPQVAYTKSPCTFMGSNSDATISFVYSGEHHTYDKFKDYASQILKGVNAKLKFTEFIIE